MDPNEREQRKYSFPNVDQNIPGTSGPYRPEDDSQKFKPKKVVNIVEALSNQKKGDEGDAQTIRTYQADIADAIKNDNVSMIKIALAEKRRQDERGGFGDNLNSTDTNRKYVVLAGIFAVLVVGGLLVGYLFIQSQNAQKQIAIQAATKVPQLLYTETSSDLNIDSKDLNELLKLIDQEKNGLMDTGTMKSVDLISGEGTSTRSATAQDFLSVLETRAPNGLLRALYPNFLFGVYAYTPREMFAVFKIKSYDTAFASMLEWEPNIETDIGTIFINKSTADMNNTNSMQVFTQKSFVDKVLSNKDARVLQDPEGKQFMLYTFLDKETLVIATSEKSLKEIMFRLTTGRIIR